MFDTLMAWFIGGVMLLGWIAWLLCLIGIGRFLEWRRGPHGAPCRCDACLRESERLARRPTPAPRARTSFGNAASWQAYEARRQDLIQRKRHYGLAPHQVDPWPPGTPGTEGGPDPAPPWWPAAQARVRRQNQAAFDRAQARARRKAADRALFLKQLQGQQLTLAELDRLWPKLFH